MPNARVKKNEGEGEDAEWNKCGFQKSQNYRANNAVTNPRLMAGKHSSSVSLMASHAKNGNTPL
jgi:hypothetical protein